VASDFQGLIRLLKKHAPQISVELSARYASEAPEYRAKLRAALHERFQEARLLDLNQIPELPNGFVSISHCRSLGGYALSKYPVGFDIEEAARVQWTFLERMWHPDDEKGPSAALHWCAKEAAFKSMGAQQPAVISQIGIHSWRPLADNVYSFEFQGDTGVATELTPWAAALFGVSN
jgi:4'-phosphopantetheinyl transferase superfamily